MPINLLNEHDLNDYLTRLVFSDGKVPRVTLQMLREIDSVECYRDAIAKSRVLQWVKHRLRAALTENTECLI